MISGGIVVASLKRNPIVLNVVTGGLLCASSDVLAQHLEHDNPNPPRNPSCENSPSQGESSKQQPLLASSMTSFIRIDWLRVASAGLIGSFFGGFVYPMAYAKLDSIWVGTHFSAVVKKALVEIATVGIFVNSISMTTRGVLRGDKDASSVFQHVSRELPVITKNDFFVWMPYNMLAFSIIPAFLRPTTTAAMEASWQTYISLRAHDFHTE